MSEWQATVPQIRRWPRPYRPRRICGWLSNTGVNLQDRESREQLAVALAKLAPEERALVSLRFDEDLTFREIGEVLELPTSTIKSQLSQAIARLRTALSGNP